MSHSIHLQVQYQDVGFHLGYVKSFVCTDATEMGNVRGAVLPAGLRDYTTTASILYICAVSQFLIFTARERGRQGKEEDGMWELLSVHILSLAVIISSRYEN